MASEQPLLSEILLQEYERLKEEQIHRIGTRDNLVYANLLSLAAVVAATIQANRPHMLLLLPPVGVIFGWTYLVNDEKVSAIGRYMRTVLGARLGRMVGEHVLGWEDFHRSDQRRRSRKVGQLVVDLITFALPALVALIGYWSSGDARGVLLAVSIAELLAIAWLVYQIMRYADFGRSSRELVTPRGPAAHAPRGLDMEPPDGIEPSTYSLRVNRSAD